MKAFAKRPTEIPRISRKGSGDIVRNPLLEFQRSQLNELLRNTTTPQASNGSSNTQVPMPGRQHTSIQAKADSSGVGEVAPALENHIQALQGRGQPLPISERKFFESRFGADFSRVNVHSDSNAAGAAHSVNAQAFTLGDHIVFGAGQYQPGTPSGRNLMAHELTHVMQQGGGGRTNLGDVIQRRRIPKRTELEDLVRSLRTTVGSRRVNLALAHRAGLARLVEMAMAEMKPPERTAVKIAARSCLRSRRKYRYLPRSVKKNLCLASAIAQKHPLGKPGKYRVPAAGNANMRILYNNARRYMKMIHGSNKYHHSIQQVFGRTAGTLQVVKSSFKFARHALETLYLAKSVFIDESGYRKAVGIPGEGSATSLELSSHIVNRPNDPYSIAVTIHESLHAGNSHLTGDPGGYNDGSKSFREVSDTDKLNNADHYTVIAWRIFAPGDSRAHGTKTFTPAKRVSGRTSRANLTPQMVNALGARKADNIFIKAMNVANDLHYLYRDIYVSPILWTMSTSKKGAPVKITYKDSLPYWSKVENLTIHKKKKIDRLNTDPRLKPVSAIDIAISEGVVRKLNLARNYIPNTPAKMQTFLKRATNSEKRAARGDVVKTQNLIISLILRNEMKNLFGHSSSVTELKALTRLVRAYAKDYRLIVKKRDPITFP